MVSVRSSELGPLGWDAVTKHQLFLQKVSSKPGPNARQHGKGTREDKASGPAPPPGSSAEHPGLGSPGHRQAQRESSVLGEGGHNPGSGSPTRVRQTQNQSHGELTWFLCVCLCVCMEKHELIQYRHIYLMKAEM